MEERKRGRLGRKKGLLAWRKWKAKKRPFCARKKSPVFSTIRKGASGLERRLEEEESSLFMIVALGLWISTESV